MADANAVISPTRLLLTRECVVFVSRTCERFVYCITQTGGHGKLCKDQIAHCVDMQIS